MTQIDLGKAPEGATHYGEGNHCKFWAKDVRPGISYQFSNVYHDGPTRWMIRLGDPDYPVTSIIPDWTGEGLPPVGTVCDVDDLAFPVNGGGGSPISGGGGGGSSRVETSWIKCTVIAHAEVNGALAAVVNSGRKIGWAYSSGKFRSIRTPAKLAAEEREKAVRNMKDIWRANYEGRVEDGLYALYDAEYRKVEVKP